MSLSPNSKSDVSHISLFSETASESQFPDCPFNLDCFDDVNMLDYKFTDEVFILIYDDRLNYLDGDFIHMTELEKNTLRHYTMVKAIDNKPITYRQVINTMIQDKYYSSKKTLKMFGHYYLEKFEKKSERMFETCWGY